MARALLVKTCRGVALAAAMLAGCTTTPVLDPAGTDPALTPSAVVRRIEASLGRDVLWGGAIIDARNLEDRTEVQVLAYPLRDSGRPDTRGEGLGRFVIAWPGYLETMDYAAGRQVTVRGQVSEVRRGQVGEASFLYPLVAGEKLHLWPADGQHPGSPPVHIGVGFWFSS